MPIVPSKSRYTFSIAHTKVPEYEIEPFVVILVCNVVHVKLEGESDSIC